MKLTTENFIFVCYLKTNKRNEKRFCGGDKKEIANEFKLMDYESRIE